MLLRSCKFPLSASLAPLMSKSGTLKVFFCLVLVLPETTESSQIELILDARLSMKDGDFLAFLALMRESLLMLGLVLTFYSS